MVGTQELLRQANLIVKSAEAITAQKIVREASYVLKVARVYQGEMLGSSWERRIASFSRRATSPQEHQSFWAQEGKRFREENGYDLDELERLHRRWVAQNKPINPENRQPHNPETAIKYWSSGVLPFLQDVFPGASQKRLFEDASPHNRAIDEALRDLIGDNGFDKYTAGMVALHSRANGNIPLYNKTKRMMAQQQAAEIARNLGAGMGTRPDGTAGKMPKYMGHGPYPDGRGSGPRYVYEGRLEDGSVGDKWFYPGHPDVYTPPPDRQPTIAPQPLGPKTPVLQPNRPGSLGQQPFQTTPGQK